MLFKDQIQRTQLQSRRSSMRSLAFCTILNALIFQIITANKILDEERFAMQVELIVSDYKFLIDLRDQLGFSVLTNPRR